MLVKHIWKLEKHTLHIYQSSAIFYFTLQSYSMYCTVQNLQAYKLEIIFDLFALSFLLDQEQIIQPGNLALYCNPSYLGG